MSNVFLGGEYCHYLNKYCPRLAELRAVELESLAVALPMEKFPHFLFGKRVQVETDQMPLENVLAKSLTQATSRLKQLLMRTLPYDFSIKYIKESTNQLAVLGPLDDKIKLHFV